MILVSLSPRFYPILAVKLRRQNNCRTASGSERMLRAASLEIKDGRVPASARYSSRFCNQSPCSYKTYAIAFLNDSSVERYFLLPPRAHGPRSLCQQFAVLNSRVAFALNAFSIGSGLQAAVTTVCTWFERIFAAQRSHLRISHVSLIADNTTTRFAGSSLAGASLSRRWLYCCRFSFATNRGVP